MDEDLDTWVAAEELIAQYGNGAEREARERVRTLLAHREYSDAAMWELVRETIKVLRKIPCEPECRLP